MPPVHRGETARSFLEVGQRRVPAAAGLFYPLRARVQRGVDRRFGRARYDADDAIAAFAARLQDAVELDKVRADLLAVVSRGAAARPALGVPARRGCGGGTVKRPAVPAAWLPGGVVLALIVHPAHVPVWIRPVSGEVGNSLRWPAWLGLPGQLTRVGAAAPPGLVAILMKAPCWPRPGPMAIAGSDLRPR